MSIVFDGRRKWWEKYTMGSVSISPYKMPRNTVFRIWGRTSYLKCLRPAIALYLFSTRCLHCSPIAQPRLWIVEKQIQTTLQPYTHSGWNQSLKLSLRQSAWHRTLPWCKHSRGKAGRSCKLRERKRKEKMMQRAKKREGARVAD